MDFWPARFAVTFFHAPVGGDDEGCLIGWLGSHFGVGPPLPDVVVVVVVVVVVAPEEDGPPVVDVEDAALEPVTEFALETGDCALPPCPPLSGGEISPVPQCVRRTADVNRKTR